LTTHAGAIAGVMLGMRQVVSAADFRTALESSFNRIRDVGGQYFAVLMSNVAHPDDDRRWPTRPEQQAFKQLLEAIDNKKVAATNMRKWEQP